MIAVFNPEHDLCLANGSAHFVAPQSALRFAAEGARLMSILYPDAVCVPAARAGEAYREVGELGGRGGEAYRGLGELDGRDGEACRELGDGGGGDVVAWGWDLALKTALLKQGIPASAMPSDEYLAALRRLQHRATVLPLQPQSRAVTTPREVEAMLGETPALVMKAPWSGSGRGLRWVTGRMSDHDRLWLLKVVREQECVIVEPRREVLADFALEYWAAPEGLRFVGYSLFVSANGVYQHNLLLSDEEIARRVGFAEGERRAVEAWLLENVVPHYAGPLGVDYLHTAEGNSLSELNLRHTMGLLAHEWLRRHPAAEGAAFSPSAWMGR